jgi:hypothetical protein
MPRIYVPAKGPDQWQALLVNPDRHWKEGFSAWALACTWHAADGFPASVERVLCNRIELRDIEVLLVLPEHQVALPGGPRPTQADAWVLARCSGGLVSMTVEGKVTEPFGPTVGDWLSRGSAGKRQRLAEIARLLGLGDSLPADVRYQLLHRTAAAVLEARRFGARIAVMLVHAFGPAQPNRADYDEFVRLFRPRGAQGGLTWVEPRAGVDLYFAWVQDELPFAATAALPAKMRCDDGVR